MEKGNRSDRYGFEQSNNRVTSDELPTPPHSKTVYLGNPLSDLIPGNLSDGTGFKVAVPRFRITGRK